MIRLVIDTNVLINGSYDESSYAFRIIREVIEGKIRAYATHQTMRENRLLLQKTVRDREYRNLLEDFFRRLNIVPSGAPVDLLDDAEDNKLLQSSQSADADYLVTDDREVLEVQKFRGTKIVTPERFWQLYRDDNGSNWSDFSKLIMGE